MKNKFRYLIILAIIIISFAITPNDAYAANDFDGYNVEHKSTISSVSITDSTISKSGYNYYTIMGNKIVIIPVKATCTGIMYLDSHFKSLYDVQDAYTSLHSTYEDALNGIYNYDESDSPDGPEEWIADAKGSSGQWTGIVEPVYNRGDILPVTSGETYYIAIYSTWWGEYKEQYYTDSNEHATVGVRTYVYPTANRVLKTGDSKYVISSGINSSLNRKTTWFEVVPDKTGVLKINIDNLSNEDFGVHSFVYLYNKNKERLSNEVWSYKIFNSKTKEYDAYFGVKKGVKYYIKVSDYAARNYDIGEETFQRYGIKCSVIEQTDRAIGTKKKAKKLVRKANATKSLFVASKTKITDWYKIYVPQKKKTRIYIDMSEMCSGPCYVSIYKNGKQIGKTKTVGAWGELKGNIVYGTTKGKASKGTYYIKVVKGTKASGKYSIRYVY